ncbi:hypothetical protein ABW19_dt0203401 [Dactylella cylindrospora]|nr:hypothetical protein ABW19_dt0203401 [Dactylella cylindrospora]
MSLSFLVFPFLFLSYCFGKKMRFFFCSRIGDGGSRPLMFTPLSSFLVHKISLPRYFDDFMCLCLSLFRGAELLDALLQRCRYGCSSFYRQKSTSKLCVLYLESFLLFISNKNILLFNGFCGFFFFLYIF